MADAGPVRCSGLLAAKGWMDGEGPMRPPTARPKKSDASGLFLHTEP